MRKMLKSLIVAFALTGSVALAAPSNFALRVGPPSIGRGGPNPISLGLMDFQLAYMFSNTWETNLSVTGLFVGKRSTFSGGGYVTLGGGVALSGNGSGPAIYSAFGADLWCGWVCFSSEYIQAVGFYKSYVLSPYAVRIGVSKWFK
jgi:hypothetical protein